MNIPQELLYQQYVRRELETYRAPYDPEAEFYSYVRQGNTEKVKELCRESFQEKKGLGILSDSPLQNLKYHFAITAAMLARYCIEGGMQVTEAYDLSDYYIHKADLMKSKKKFPPCTCRCVWITLLVWKKCIEIMPAPVRLPSVWNISMIIYIIVSLSRCSLLMPAYLPVI